MTSTALKIMCAGLVLLLAGCGDQKPQQKLVAFSQANNAEPYRATQKALMEKLFAGSPDTKLVVSDAQQDNSKQIAQIETFIRQKPSVLIVAPNERAALTAVMGKAMQAGIPVICLERDILEPNYTTYIRMDNKAIGRLAGQFIVDQLTKKYGSPKGNVVMLRGLLGVEAEINRDGGAREVLSRYPQIHVVADPVADWIQAQAKDRMTEVLRVQPQIDIVYGHNDPMAVGAYLAAKELGREKEMLFIGVDGLGGPSGGIKKVVDGVLAATFVYPLGVKEAVEVAQKIIKDPSYKPDKEITLSSTMVTPENAADLYKKLTVATD
ncbi:MAG: substrate-binding domain-containing protein [Rhizomicrobium sp.]